MDPELEIAAAASAGGLLRWRARRPVKLGSPCANCGETLEGPYCHVCGQLAEDFERSIWSLAFEAVEHFFDTDGRIFQTLPRLILRPASLTRDYLAGKRASQTPPLRLFLVVVVLVFFIGGLGEGAKHPIAIYKADKPGEIPISFSSDASPRTKAIEAWLRPRLGYVISHQDEFGAAIESWFHRIAIMFLPVATLILGLLFLFKKGVFLFDHAIFSMHSLSFMGLLYCAGALMVMAGPFKGFADFLYFVAPTHLFLHVRGVYRTSVFGTLLRMFLLFIFSLIALLLLFLAVVAVELNGMGVSH